MSSITEKRIMILASIPSALKETERFLSNRGWALKTHSDLKLFLNDLIRFRPQAVFLSQDFSHQNLPQLRKLITQVYKLKVYDFSEDQSLASWSRLKALRHEDVIFGPLSGPAIERTLTPAEALVLGDSSASHVPTVGERIRRGAERVVSEIFDREVDGDVRALVWAERVTCIFVESPVLSGYFVVAQANDRVLDEKISSLLREALIAMMGTHGVQVSEGRSFPLEIRRVEFKKWAQQTAEFLLGSIHQGQEVAMAFFPVDAQEAILPSTVDGKLGSLEIDEIRLESALEFDLFLHLPLNGKFILYVSSGGAMSLQQQMQLQSKGIKRVYFKSEKRHLVRKEKARWWMDRAVANYYERAVS